MIIYNGRMKKEFSQNVRCTDLFTRQQFRRVETAFSRHFKLPLQACDAMGKEIRSLCSPDCLPEFCQRIRRSKFGFQRCRQDRLRSLNIAFETGRPHITLCHAGIVLACVPIMDGEVPLGGLFFGRCLWEPFDKTLEADVQNRLRGLQIYPYEILWTLSNLPVVGARRIHEAAEFLYVLLYQTTDLDPYIIRSRRQRALNRSQNSESHHDTTLTGPGALECQLIARIKLGDRTGAREILNLLLGRILFAKPPTINLLKGRLAELLSKLNRAATGSDIETNTLLNKHIDHVHRVLSIDTREELWVWMSRVLDDFIESVYTSQDAAKMTQLKPAIQFMQGNFDRPLKLAQVALVARMSPSRLSHLFREQMGITPVDYLTALRVNYAKRLLLETETSCTRICYAVGYSSQSHFIGAFKQITRMTPTAFRKQNKRP